MDHVELLAAVVDDAPIGFAVLDQESRFVYVNRGFAAIHGLSPAEHLGRSLSQVSAGERAAVTEPSIRQVLVDGQPRYDAEVTIELAGAVRTLAVNRYPVRDGAASVIGVAVSVLDVTAQRRVSELEAETAALREVARAAHRLTVADVSRLRASEVAADRARADAVQAQGELRAEHVVLRMFQQAMLPTAVPDLPGIDLAVAYLPVTARMEVGGDWYDAFVLPDERLAIAVGDVAGHDAHAATIMGQVRNAVRAYALLGLDPGVVLQHINTLLLHQPGTALVSMLYGVYDPELHRLTWSSAGHPPPLLYHDGGASVGRLPTGVVLGAHPRGVPYPHRTTMLAPGDTVLWYTDGLVERRGHDLFDTIEQLRELMTSHHGSNSVSELVAHLVDAMFSGDDQEDDVCLLAVHRH